MDKVACHRTHKKSKTFKMACNKSSILRAQAEKKNTLAGYKSGIVLRMSSTAEIPLSSGRELHLQDFTAPLFITRACHLGHH